jgi:hypothetical protein
VKLFNPAKPFYNMLAYSELNQQQGEVNMVRGAVFLLKRLYVKGSLRNNHRASI